jgi:hypothetical protein
MTSRSARAFACVPALLCTALAGPARDGPDLRVGLRMPMTWRLSD